MRRRFFWIFLFTAAATFLMPATATNAQPTRTTLHDGWEFRQARGHNWYPATVPGVVHTDLMANGIIEDPFMRLGERAVQWVDKEDWIYRTTFDMDAATFDMENITLIFKGLDTYADVTLNDSLIVNADNMFREWSADVKGLLKPTGNELQIHFHSPIRIAMPMWEATPWREIIESGNDQSAQGGLFNRRVGVFTRKAGYHYGWDWGPRLVTSGIWRPVVLEAWNDALIDNVFYQQLSVNERRADVQVTVTTNVTQSIPNGEIIITNRTDGRRVAHYRGRLDKGENERTLTFTMNRPRLWWTNGLGEPHLYDFVVEVKAGDRTLDVHEQKLGIRSLRLVIEEDKWGESHYFELNGVPVFMKGANYIPCDNFLPRVTDEIYERTIRDAVESNYNMLRVWGGGIYENDIFYELCDRYGILVWQDFMFACALYPFEGEIVENIKEEARQNVRRLRNHTCLALWCGGNENVDMWFNWGVRRRYERHDPQWAETVWGEQYNLYFNVLPAIVAKYHPGIAYTPSSPYSDEQGTRSEDRGTTHDWDVWGRALEFDLYNTKRSRFFSEYGFQGFPPFQSVVRFAPEERDWSATSEVMLAHQRAGTNGNQKIDAMLARDYGAPRDFFAFLYMSQLMQADAMRLAMESHRRQMPRCMGSLIWQHNDCWPAVSWAGRDWYGTWKAQQYAIRRAFSEVIISPVEEDGMLRLYTVSDRLRPANGVLTVRTVDLQTGEMHVMDERPVRAAANNSTVVWEHAAEELFGDGRRENVVVHFVFAERDGREHRNNYFPAKNKYLAYRLPELSVKTRHIGGREYEVTASSVGFARAVYIYVDGAQDYRLSDNFFDMLPGETRTITITFDDDAPSGIERRVQALSFADARAVATATPR
ncbi:MAG: glycoside hydrolase family 2 protein [Rikenellaceae bacterium]|nr:glycoside hydrolase family 2 protein [Rikenellaceae bacterium]MCL2692294.1 glycoside hydrolase family 2 protein [Rikenellaceae bacterium]